MKSMGVRLLKGLVMFAGFLLLLPTAGEGATVKLTCSATETIGKSVLRLKPGDILLVRGACKENVDIPEQIFNVTLDGQGSATISGPNTRSSNISINGRGITIKGFIITGANNGILVGRGGSALIESNTIQSTGGNGINMNQQSSARIVNNTIQNNPSHGIQVNENSLARIGSFLAQEAAARPNTIQGNGGYGIFLRSSSSAVVVGNTVTGNKMGGIGVNQVSHALIASNTINGNEGDGILVMENSGVDLGNETGKRPREAPNSTSALNSGFGIRCTLLSYANGRLGGLNGKSGAKNFSNGCIDNLKP